MFILSGFNFQTSQYKIIIIPNINNKNSISRFSNLPNSKKHIPQFPNIQFSKLKYFFQVSTCWTEPPFRTNLLLGEPPSRGLLYMLGTFWFDCLLVFCDWTIQLLPLINFKDASAARVGLLLRLGRFARIARFTRMLMAPLAPWNHSPKCFQKE